MKKTIFTVLFLMMMLCACGKKQAISVDLGTEQVETEVAETEEIEIEAIETETVETEEVVAKHDAVEKSVANKAQKEKTKSENTTTKKTEQESKKETVVESDKQEKTVQNSSSTSDKRRKLVDSYNEEIRGEEVSDKFGVTKCEVIKNMIAVYSDGTEQIKSSTTKTEYNVEGYHATDAELYRESEQITVHNMACYEEILRMVNERRAEVGAAPLTLDITMCKAATMRAIEMDYSGYYSHTRPDGTDCFTALEYVGVESGPMGENIAAGQMNASWVMASWTRSEGHYQNMINPNYTKIGVGLSEVGAGGMRKYWCQLFAQ